MNAIIGFSLRRARNGPKGNDIETKRAKNLKLCITLAGNKTGLENARKVYEDKIYFVSQSGSQHPQHVR